MIIVRLLFFTLSLLIYSSIATAQGIIRGSVIEDATAEPMFAVTVVIKNTTTGASTDFDGKFEIKAEPGNYTLQVSFVSYKTLFIENVEVKAGEVTVLDGIRMLEDVETLEEIIITAEVIKTSEEALLTVKKKSANLLDGISSANFSLMGDGDAAAAVKRVPGVSIEGGKYVYVRGLGDRYTKSILNGVDVPGLDPDRNTIQMDMFPTSLIDNIIVVKSFTSDLPADFTGGVVDINTKDFPEEKIFSVSVSTGFNPSMHFNSAYVSYDGSSTDFLGFDDGQRAIPTEGIADIPLYSDVVGKPDSEIGQQYQGILQGFNPIMTPTQNSNLMNLGLGLTLGNQFSGGVNTWGYNFTINYDNNTQFFEDAEYALYRKQAPSITQLERLSLQRGDKGSHSVNLSGLAGIALKRERAKYILNILHTQNGESQAGIFDLDVSRQGSVFTASQYNLEYSERSLTNILLNGVHYDNTNTWQIEWKISPTRSKLTDPDVRITNIRTDGGTFSIGTEVGLPQRLWRFLEEENLTGKVDLQKNLPIFNRDAKVKFGGVYTYKQRDYNIQDFQISPSGVDISANNPDIMFRPENLWPNDDNGFSGTRFDPRFIPINTNLYDANITNIGTYISTEFQPTESLKAIFGVRMENYQQRYTGQNQQGVVLDNKKVIDDVDIFPAVNLIYALTERQNVRASYSRTIARPSFKEASFAEILDPITGRTFIGGFFPDVDADGNQVWDGNLQATLINNFDIRWELFQDKGQTISLSGFAKFFDAPIEIVQYIQALNNFQPRNVGDGRVLGVELEIRKNLSFISPRLENFALNGNITIADSRIEMNPVEFESRVLNSREGENIENTRDMAGQAPYIINTGLSYRNPIYGLDAGIFYNVQGRTLAIVGIGSRPDIYSVPFHSLNFNANKTFGAEARLRAGIKIDNILNDLREEVFESFNAEDQIFTRFGPGTTFSVRLGYNFW
ncbi:MAG: TonB-dependent receptor [Bacteroidota bacterium]